MENIQKLERKHLENILKEIIDVVRKGDLNDVADITVTELYNYNLITEDELNRIF